MKDKQALEDERDRNIAELAKKEKEYEVTKGHKFLKRDEFKYSPLSPLSSNKTSGSPGLSLLGFSAIRVCWVDRRLLLLL